jgi:hypothetical protein
MSRTKRHAKGGVSIDCSLLSSVKSAAEAARFVMAEFVNENMNLLVKVGRFEDQSKTA